MLNRSDRCSEGAFRILEVFKLILWNGFLIRFQDPHFHKPSMNKFSPRSVDAEGAKLINDTFSPREKNYQLKNYDKS